MTLPEVRPGQVWADNDRRSKGRILRVDAVSARHAQCVVLISATPGGRTGHTVRILLERMKPVSNGYRLLTDDETSSMPSEGGGAA
ncbi:DUF6354 family protein [Streptomyces lasalocidi]